MPVVIQEIQINIEVGDTSSSQKGPETKAQGSDDKEEIISQCVEEVLRILKEKEER